MLIIYVLFCLSLLLNTCLGYLFYKKKHIVQKDAKALLAELLSGPTIIKIEVLDTSNLFYRSPRG